MIHLTPSPVPVAADLGRRRLRGQAVPWNVDATVSTGQRVRFLPGSVDLSGVPVVLHHDETKPIGKVIDAADDDTGQTVVASVSGTPDGDEALLLAADDVLTGWSVGVEPVDHSMDGDTLVVASSKAHHLALVVRPAFDSARVLDVAAAAGSADVDLDDGTTVTVTIETDDDQADDDQADDTEAPTPPGDGNTPQEGSEMDTTTEAAAPGRVAAAPRLAASGSTRIPSLGQYLYAMVNRRTDPTTFAAMTAAVQAANTTTGDVPGIIPEPIYGDVISARAVDRPVLSAFGPLAGPESGASFRRPVITDPLADAAAAAEKSDVTDTLGVTDVTVAYTFVKRAANISAEAIAYTSPAVLDVVATDLARAYARGTEKVAAGVLGAAGGTGVPILDDGSDATVVLYDAAAAIYGVVGVLPDTLLVSPDMWALIGGWADTDGRPLFPVLGPQNAAGSSDGVTAFGLNVLGLRVVVSWALAPGTIRLCASPFVETYEAHRMSMRADEPTVLGVGMGIGGSAAAVVLNDDAVVRLNATAPA